MRQLALVCRYSFGTGVEVLPIPELVPFRLTRFDPNGDVVLDSHYNSREPQHNPIPNLNLKLLHGPCNRTSNISALCALCEGSCKARCSRTTRARCWPRRWWQAWLRCGRGVMRWRCQPRAPALQAWIACVAALSAHLCVASPAALILSHQDTEAATARSKSVRSKVDHSTCDSTNERAGTPL